MRLAIVAVLLCATPLSAQCFRRNCSSVVSRRVVQSQVVTPVQTLFLVAPPSFYGAPTYSAPQSASSSPDLQTTLEKIVQALSNLDARMQKIEGVVDVDESPGVVQQHCGMCHTGDEPKGGFALSDLKDPLVAAKAIKLVAAEKMPVGPEGDHVTLDASVRQELIRAIGEMK